MSEVFISGIVVFVLAAFVGLEVISKVPVILHTPLMSGSNFVHGIVIVGAMVALPYLTAVFLTTLIRAGRDPWSMLQENSWH